MVQYINTGWGNNVRTGITSRFCVMFGLLCMEIMFHS
jgi:hypothetical protein